MATAPSWQELYDAARADLVAVRPDLAAEEGDITDFLLAAAASTGDYAIGYAASRMAELFLDSATGDALTALADDRYGIQRTAAAKALVTLTFSRSTAAAGAGTIASGTVVATTVDALGNTVQFETTASVSYGALETGSKTVQAQAVVAGTAGNVLAGTLTRIVSTLFDSSITCTNVARAAGGAEQESDEALRERVRTFPSTIRRGTIGALEYGAKTVPGISSAKVSEGETGLVTVYVADAGGGSNAELNALVQVELDNWRAAGTVVQVQSAVLRTENVAFALLVKPGFDVAAATPVIQAAVSTRMGKLTMGETLWRDELTAAIIAVDQERIFRVVYSAPTTDIEPAANEVIRPGSITVSEL